MHYYELLTVLGNAVGDIFLSTYNHVICCLSVMLFIAAAVSYQSILLYTGDGNQTYPIEAINNYLDWVNVMNYDYHGSWECCNTGEHTALYDPTSNLNTNYGISNWLKAGLRQKKCALGLAYYGKTWTLVSLKNTSVGAPTSKAGDYLLYRDIVTFNKEAPKSTVLLDKATVSMISFKSNLTWVGYDNPTTIARKVNYAKRRGLLGYFAWALHHDDDKHSLAKAGECLPIHNYTTYFCERCKWK
jgi:chitinase